MKNFHSVSKPKKMLAYGSQKGMGPFGKRPRRKKAAPGATNTQDGKAEQKSSELNHSTAIISGIQEETQDEN